MNNPWKWHSDILIELSYVAGEMDLNEDKVEILNHYNALYSPKNYAQLAWPLMKLYRDLEARAMIQKALSSTDIYQHEVAYNSWGALESERLNRREAYEIFLKLIDYLKVNSRSVSPVYYGNGGGAAMGMLRFNDAERLWQEATKNFEADTNTNPWFFLVDLYTMEGRFIEALEAIKEGIDWQMKQPGYKDQQKKTQLEGYTIRFLLATGQIDIALEKAGKLINKPDRMGVISSAKEQFRSGTALLYRRALLDKISLLREENTWCNWSKYFINQLNIIRYRFIAWRYSRYAASMMMKTKRLANTLAPYGEGSIVFPQWLLSDLVPVIGSGVFIKGIDEARELAKFPPLEPYYNAMVGEAKYFSGDYSNASESILRGLATLPKEEVLYRTRLYAMLADINMRNGEKAKALDYLSKVMSTDPGVLRRLDIGLPIEVKGDKEIAKVVYKSPRFKKSLNGFKLVISGSGWDKTAVFQDMFGTVLKRISIKKPKDALEAKKAGIPFDPDKALLQQCHKLIFSPPIDLSQANIFSLDGSPLSPNQDVMKNINIIMKKKEDKKDIDDTVPPDY